MGFSSNGQTQAPECLYKKSHYRILSLLYVTFWPSIKILSIPEFLIKGHGILFDVRVGSLDVLYDKNEGKRCQKKLKTTYAKFSFRYQAM